VGFFSRPALERALNAVARDGHVLLDARSCEYIDPDVLDLIDDYRTTTAPARGVSLSLVGLKDHYDQLPDHIQFIDYSSRELRQEMTPRDVLTILRQGNERFCNGEQITRDLLRQVEQTSEGQTPLAAVLGCIDSRAPTELLFDLGIGDIFTIRVAGNTAPPKVLGSVEYACAVAGSKLLLVLGHTSCGAVTAAVDFFQSGKTAADTLGCQHIDVLLEDIRHVLTDPASVPSDQADRRLFVDEVARQNVLEVIQSIRANSRAIDRLCESGALLIVGGMYNVETGRVEIFEPLSSVEGQEPAPQLAS
jgi:carbonic anhydrase/SulP family sulfate permease